MRIGGLSQFLMVSTALHVGVGMGVGRSVRWAGVAETHRMSRPMQIAWVDQVVKQKKVLETVKSEKRQKVDTRGKGRVEAEIRGHDRDLDRHPLAEVSFHGVHLMEQGISERYTSELHAFLQNHMRKVFQDVDVDHPLEFSVSMDISAQGQVKKLVFSQNEGFLGRHLRKAFASAKALREVPAPGEMMAGQQGFSVVVPITIRSP